MQRVSLLGRIANISLLGGKALLRRKVFTMEVPDKEYGVPCFTVADREHVEKLLQPLAHILQGRGKQIRVKCAHAYNYWLKLPADKLVLVKDIAQFLHHSILLIDDIQDNAILRRGIPVAHSIYGVASTISAANYLLLEGLKRLQNLNHSDAIRVCIEQQLEMYYGQELDIYWRDNYTCPSIEEYKENIKRKCRSLTFEFEMMQRLSDNNTDFTELNSIFSLYLQIRDDYCNLCLQQYAKDTGYCEDLTEGKFSFPVVHAIRSHPDDHQVIRILLFQISSLADPTKLLQQKFLSSCDIIENLNMGLNSESDILRQRTRDVELKKYCLTLLEKFGSLSYTRQTLEKLDAEVRVEVAKLGGNPLLEDVMDELLNWKREVGDKSPEQ